MRIPVLWPLLAACALLAASAVHAQGPDTAYTHLTVPLTEVSATVDLPPATPKQGMTVVARAPHMFMVREDSLGLAEVSLAEAADGEYFAGLSVQSCQTAEQSVLSLQVLCMEPVKHGAQGCPDPVPFNVSVTVFQFTEDWGTLDEGTPLHMGFPLTGGSGAPLLVRVSTPKSVDAYASIAVSAVPVHTPPDLPPTDLNGTSLGISSKLSSSCPAVYGGDYDNYAHANAPGIGALAVSTAELDADLRGEREYYVFFASSAYPSFYMLSVALLPGSGSGSGGGGGLSAGWATALALGCFALGFALPVAAFAAYRFYQKRTNYDEF